MNAYHHDLIALGDFNIDERGDLLDRTFLSEGLYVPPELQNENVTRSIFNATKFYDQIAWFDNESNGKKLSMEFINGGNYDFVPYALRNRGPNEEQLFLAHIRPLSIVAEFKV